MNKTFYILLLGLTLLGCVASASAVKTLQSPAPGVIVKQNHNEMLELARDMEEERVKTIYVVVISEPEIVTAKPPEK